MPPSRHSTSAAPSVYQHPQSQAHSAGPSLKLTLWIHGDSLKQEAWLNYDLFPPGTCNPGDLVEVKPAHTNSNARKGSGHGVGEGGASSSAEGRIESGDDEGAGAESRGRGGVAMKRGKSDGGASSGPQMGAGDEGKFLFVVREMEKDLWLKQPKMQVYLPSSLCSSSWADISDLGWIGFSVSQRREPLRVPTSQFSHCDSCGYSKLIWCKRSAYMLTPK